MNVPTIACIVEGHGDVAALPVLLHRLVQQAGLPAVRIPNPIRVPKSKILRPRGIESHELDRALQLAARNLTSRQLGGILILLDADDSCPKLLGPDLLQAARSLRPDIAIAVTLAKREFEAWFLAATRSLKASGYLAPEMETGPAPEEVRDPKRLLGRHLLRGKAYSETIDQRIFAGQMDLSEAAECDSFRKLRRDVLRLLKPATDNPTRENP